jgi:hypothetical protein
MAIGKRQEERIRMVELADWIGSALNGDCTAYAKARFVNRGALPDGSDRHEPPSEDVDRLAAQIARDGKLIVR